MYKDVEIKIHLLSNADGNTFALFGGSSRPQIAYDGRDWCTAFYTDDPQRVINPGETATAYLALLSPDEHLGKLYVGKEFLLRYGQITIAHGHITRILDLENSAQHPL